MEQDLGLINGTAPSQKSQISAVCKLAIDFSGTRRLNLYTQLYDRSPQMCRHVFKINPFLMARVHK